MPLSDFNSGAAGDPGAQDQPLGLSGTVTNGMKLAGEEEIVQNLSNMQIQKQQMDGLNQMGASMGADALRRGQSPMKGKFTIDVEKGTVSGTGMSQDWVEGLLRDQQQLNEIRGSFMQEASRLKAQEDRVRGNPVMALATALGANLAQDPNMPGWVQGAGRTSAALNPTADELRNRRLAVMEKSATIGGRSEANVMSALRAEETMRHNLATEGQKKEDSTYKRADKMATMLRLMTRQGQEVPKEAVDAIAGILGATPEETELAMSINKGSASTALAGMKATEERKEATREKYATFKQGLDKEMAKFKGAISRDNRRDAIRQAFQNSISPDKMSFELKVAEHKAAIAAEAAENKEAKTLGPVGQRSLAQMSATNDYIGTMESAFENPVYASVQGPLFQVERDKEGNIAGFKLNEQAVIPKQFQSLWKTELDTGTAHEMPRVLSILFTTGAGATLFRSEKGIQLLNNMGITDKVDARQALEILKVIRDTNNSNVAAQMRVHRKAKWGEMQDLTGASDPRNDYFFRQHKDRLGNTVRFPDAFGTTETSAAPEPTAKGKNSYTDPTTGKTYTW